jgi:tetratricopeptide (TPR) repeat protein
MAKENVETLCQRAQQAIAQGQNDQARQLYLQALALRSDVPDVHYGIATVCFLLNDLAGAAYHFKEVTRLDPLRAGAFVNLGAVYNRMDQFDEAIPVLRRGIQLDMNRAEGYYNLGLVYRRKGQPDLAIQAYREATRVNPRMADAHYNLANLYLEKEQWGLAIAHYRQALELRPNWEKAQRGLQQAEGAQESGETANLPTVRVENINAPPPPKPAIDPNRVVDPQQHGAILSTLHRATIDTETHTRTFLKVLESEMEPAIKDLSSALLYPDSSSGDLAHCMKKYEDAMASLRSIQASLEGSLDKTKLAGDQLLHT